MAYITYGSTASAFPSVYSDPKYPKDIVINGILFDIDTFTPKIGSHVMMWTGDFSASTTKTYTSYDDDDIYYFDIPNNDTISGQYSRCFSPNYPYVARDIKTDGTHYDTATNSTFLYDFTTGRTDLWGRDFLDHPIKVCHYNETTSEYVAMAPYQNYLGHYRFDKGVDGWTRYQEMTYSNQGGGSGNYIIDADTDSGMLYMRPHSQTTMHTMKLAVINYTTESQLHTSTATEIYAPQTTAQPVYIHHLTKLNNGDHIFLASEGASGVGSGMNVDLIRYDNSSDSITYESQNFDNQYSSTRPMSIPSNVVFHQETADTSTSKKICYYYPIATTTFDSVANAPWLITMDVENNTVSIESTATTYTPPVMNAADDDISAGHATAYGPDYMYDQRIVSASQDIDSQKYLFVFLTGTGNAGAETAHDQSYLFLKINASDAATLTGVSTAHGTWNSLLTASSKNDDVSGRDTIPWCVAPLNVEHTLMMVYCKYSTHLVKFDTSTETLSEIWMDDDTYFQEVMWLPSGKVLTQQYENKFGNGVSAVDWHAPRPIQVWSEDLIYNVDITTSNNYVAYAGSNVNNTLSVSAFDGSNNYVATDLTLQIVGPATFDNSAKTKTVTTSASAAVTETITISDSGHVEVEVIEIQS